MPVSDEERIRKTLARFCQALDDRRFEDWSNTFTEDGAFGTREGRAAIHEMILGGELALQPDLRRKHTVTNAVIDVHGDTAEATSDLVMFDKTGDSPWTIRVGRYYDTLARQADGEWLFTRRRLEWLD
jgi:3-phenylpropionate/cinnamic acid dioxygenase small subunit